MKIEFIIPTYNRPDNLMMILYSIKSQTIDKWSVHVVADAPYDGYEEVKNHFSGDDRFRFSELNGPHGDWGHTARNYGLSKSQEEWVVMSGDDNYYVPVFVEEFLSAATISPDINFVYCNMVHNYTDNQYIPMVSRPVTNWIDIGNFMTKRQYSKQMRLDTSKVDADGRFAEEYIQKFKGKTAHIKKFLYVHN